MIGPSYIGLCSLIVSLSPVLFLNDLIKKRKALCLCYYALF